MDLDEAAKQNRRNHIRITVGQFIAALILIAIIISATICSVKGDWKSACALAGMGCANIAAVFIGQEYSKKH